MAGDKEIGRLVVVLAAQTVELATGLKKAEGMVSSFKDVVQKVLGGLSLAVVGAKFAAAITGAKDYAVEISKTAEKIGVPIETLSKMADAADDVGLNLGGLATGLKFLSRNMFDAAQGTGEAKAIFEALGVQFKNADGSLRPLEDTMLDLADVFSKMEDGPAKTAMALKLLGRSGQEMIPLMNLGRKTLREWMDDAEAAGKKIDDPLGKNAREFNRTMKNVHDALQGISLSVMRQMLPSLQAMAKWLLSVATAMNSFRKDAYLVSEALRYMAAVVIPLFLLKLGSMVSLVGIANLALRGFGAVLTFLSGPIGWVTAAIVGLSVLWTALGSSARAAAREHEKFADSIRTMKMDELRETLRDTSLELALLEQRYRAMIEELEKGPSFNPFADMMKGKEAGEAQKKIDELKERIKILQAAIGDVNKEKIEPPVLPNDEALKKLEGKLAQLRAEIISLGDPVAGAKAALEAFISETMRGVPETPKLSRVIRELRQEFALLTALQQVRANLEAREKGTVSVAAARADAETAALKRNYDQGLVDLHGYYSERRRITSEQAELEIRTLEDALSRAKTPAERTSIQAEIDVKTTTKGKAIAEEVKAESDAFKELFKTMSGGDLAQFVASNDLYMAQLQASYDDGLISLETFMSERRRVLEENAREEIGALEAQIPGMDPTAAQAAADQVISIRQKLNADLFALNREEVERERAVQLQRLENASFVASGMGNIFGQLYEQSGKKLKAFFFLQKAMAIAEIYINTAVAAMKAMGQLGIFGLPMSSIIWAMGAANIAMVMAQTVAGFAKGGPVRSGSGRKDDVPAMLTKGEFVQPEPAVRYYGIQAMEAIRRMLVPRDALRGFGFFPVARPQFAFAGGGSVTGGASSTSITIPMAFNAPVTDRLVDKLEDRLRRTVVQVLKEETRD